MSLEETITSLENTLINSGFIGTYKGYPTVPFNFPSTAIKDPDTGLICYSDEIGLRGASITQRYSFSADVTQTFYLGRAFLVQNQQIKKASAIIASELGANLLRVINDWGVGCGIGVDRLSDLRATPQVKQDEKIAQALRAIASPNSPDILTSYWYAEVIVSFSMKYYL
jgi:hypothetical protein